MAKAVFQLVMPKSMQTKCLTENCIQNKKPFTTLVCSTSYL